MNATTGTKRLFGQAGRREDSLDSRNVAVKEYI